MLSIICCLLRPLPLFPSILPNCGHHVLAHDQSTCAFADESFPHELSPVLLDLWLSVSSWSSTVSSRSTFQTLHTMVFKHFPSELQIYFACHIDFTFVMTAFFLMAILLLMSWLQYPSSVITIEMFYSFNFQHTLCIIVFNFCPPLQDMHITSVILTFIFIVQSLWPCRPSQCSSGMDVWLRECIGAYGIPCKSSTSLKLPWDLCHSIRLLSTTGAQRVAHPSLWKCGKADHWASCVWHVGLSSGDRTG